MKNILLRFSAVRAKNLILLLLLLSAFGSHAQQCSYLINERFANTSTSTFSPNWTSSGLYVPSGTGYMGVDGNGDWLRTPLLTTPGNLEFTYYKNSSGAWIFNVQVSTNGTSWTTVQTVNVASGTNSTSWIPVTVSLGAYSNIYVRFLDGRGSGSAVRYFTNIVVYDRTSTTITPCSGNSATITCGTTYNFYDPGGLGNYDISQDYTFTIYPSTAGSKVRINFSSLVTESASCAQNFDRLYLYDGNSTSAAALHPTTNSGGYWSGSCPANALAAGTVFTSTAADGSITIRFRTDGSTVDDGWIATVSCYTPDIVTLDGSTVSSNCWWTDGNNDYTITAKATGSSPTSIGGNTYGMLALVNYQGAHAGVHGGYYAWNTTQALLNAQGYTQNQMACTGGGYIGMQAGAYGSSTATLISGSTTVSGNQRTVNWVVRPNSTFPHFTDNSISQYAQSLAGTTAGWTESTNLMSSSSPFVMGTLTVNGNSTASDLVEICPGQTIAVSQSGFNNQGGSTYFYSDNTTGLGGWAVVPEWEIMSFGSITAANQVAGQNNVNDQASFNYKINSAGTYILHANSYYGNCYGSGTNRYISIVSPTALTTVSPSSASICSGNSQTLTASGGTTVASDVVVWQEGACNIAYEQNWTSMPFTTPNTTVNSVNGILTVTSTSIDPMIDMTGLGSYNPATYRYINIRYRVTAGTAGNTEIFFYNTAHPGAIGGETGFGSLISDGAWHILTIDMHQDPDYLTGGNITGWRYDWATASGVTMQLDFISLDQYPIFDSGSSISVSPTSTKTYYASKRSNCGATGCVSATVSISAPANPANVVSATGATLASGDFLWSGNTSTAWGTAANWYQYNGSAFSTSATVPTSTNRVFILPSSTANTCISASNIATVSAAGSSSNLFIGANATMIISASQTLEVYGNWTNNGTFTPNTGSTVGLRGNAAQSIGGSGTNAFVNLTVNKSGNNVTFSAPASVTGTLTMTAGNILTSSANLLTVGSSAATPGSISWTSGTVIGPLRRYFANSANATQASGIFPVGNASVNRYATVNYTSAPGGGTITAEYKAGICPAGINGITTTVNGQLITNYEDEGYWEITPTGGNLNSTAYSLTLRGNTLTTINTLSKARIIKSVSHTTWDNSGVGTHTAPSGSTSDFTITNTGMSGFSFFNIGSDNSNPLPIQLSGFSASCNAEHEVNIHWTTASELNSDHFIVEKSRDLDAWQTVAEVHAAGNSNATKHYSTSDVNPYSEISYYRLVQKDFDGQSKTYDPVSVSCTESETSTISVFPNPNQGNFTVEIFNGAGAMQAEVVLSDLAGKKISSRSMNIYEDKNNMLFEENGLKTGTYLLHVQTADRQFVPVRVAVY